MLAYLVFWLAATPAPFNKVANPTAEPSPWRGGETYQLALEVEGRGGPNSRRFKHQATATLTVRKIGAGFALKVRRLAWWSGSGPADCQIDVLVHAQDLDVTTDEHGTVSALKLHPPPGAEPDR